MLGFLPKSEQFEVGRPQSPILLFGKLDRLKRSNDVRVLFSISLCDVFLRGPVFREPVADPGFGGLLETVDSRFNDLEVWVG